MKEEGGVRRYRRSFGYGMTLNLDINGQRLQIRSGKAEKQVRMNPTLVKTMQMQQNNKKRRVY